MKVGGLSAVGRGTGASDHPDDHTDIEQLFEVMHMDLLSFYYTPDHRMGRRNAGLRGHISATGYYWWLYAFYEDRSISYHEKCRLERDWKQ